MTSTYWLVIFLFLVFLGVPIAPALGLGVWIAISLTGAYPFILIPNMIFTGLDSFTLVSVPFFILCGKLMCLGNAGNRIFDFANASVGWMRGGLGATNIVSSIIFGGISGSGVADVGAMGRLEVTAMVKQNYPLNYSCALTAVSAILSPIIPPSVIMIVYANVAGVSSVKMLVSGLIPGVFAGVVMLIINYYLAFRYNWRSSSRFSFRELVQKTRQGFWALLSPIILIGGLLFGIFTPTESALIAAFYAAMIGLILYRDLPLSRIMGALIETGRDSGTILLILGTAMIASHVLAADGITAYIADLIFSITRNPSLILLLMVGFYLFIGMIMETIATIIIIVPVFLPIAKEVGISPIHFGVIMIVSNCIGYVTPPVGVCLFAICTVVKEATLEGVSKACLPFIIGLTVFVVILVFFPIISEFLPSFIQ